MGAAMSLLQATGHQAAPVLKLWSAAHRAGQLLVIVDGGDYTGLEARLKQRRLDWRTKDTL